LIKEALTKSSILIGVPKAIETMLELSELVEEGDMSMSFVRKNLDRNSSTFEERSQAGRTGLGTVYRGNIDEIFQKFREGGLEDIRKLKRFRRF
jgi:hypothetical protein